MGSPLHHVLFSTLLVGIPIWDYYETRALRSAKDPRAKVRAYRRLVIVLWALALLALVSRPSWAELLEYPAALDLPLPEASGIVVVALLLGLLMQPVLVRVSASMRQTVTRQFAALDFFMPRTAAERRWWVPVSVTAGVCEEVLYRGFLLVYLAEYVPVVGPLGIVGISALMFGLSHGYQGLAGVVGTAVMGALLVLVFWTTGSLLWPIVLHAVVDLRILLLPRSVVEGGGPELPADG